jgi:hypothetical protein
MKVLAIDPGIRGCGVAAFDEGVLFKAVFVSNTVKEGSGPEECASMAHAVREWSAHLGWGGCETLALEVPQIYSRGGGKSLGDPNNIMPLFGVVSAIAALHPASSVEWERPRGWKGNTPKPETAKEKYVIKERVIARLSTYELTIVQWPSLQKKTDTAKKQDWDVADAIGIGMHVLGRFERMRMFSRE